jgi:hypothetical protein
VADQADHAARQAKANVVYGGDVLAEGFHNIANF